MKIKASLLIISILVFIFSCSSGKNNDGKAARNIDTVEHNIPEFEVDYPETQYGVEKTETINRNLGGILITNWILQGAENNDPFMYFVSHNVVPKNLDKLIKDDPNQLRIAFQALLTSSAAKLGGTDFKFAEIYYSDYSGMESICKVFNGEGLIKSRVYLIEDNIFMISAGGRNIDVESVNRFLNSFKLK